MTLQTIGRQLRAASRRDDLTIDELVGSAEDLLGVLAPKQTRYRVRERPDVRTIRYYVTQGLLPKPVSYRGGRARYSGTHLLRLLAIKRLQMRHFTLEAIRRRLEGSTDAELRDELLGARPSREGTAPSRPATSRPATDKTVSPSFSENEPRQQALECDACRRVALPSGGELLVPDHALDDPPSRTRLAADLEALARKLRDSGRSPTDVGSTSRMKGKDDR